MSRMWNGIRYSEDSMECYVQSWSEAQQVARFTLVNGETLVGWPQTLTDPTIFTVDPVPLDPDLWEETDDDGIVQQDRSIIVRYKAVLTAEAVRDLKDGR